MNLFCDKWNHIKQIRFNSRLHMYKASNTERGHWAARLPLCMKWNLSVGTTSKYLALSVWRICANITLRDFESLHKTSVVTAVFVCLLVMFLTVGAFCIFQSVSFLLSFFFSAAPTTYGSSPDQAPSSSPSCNLHHRCGSAGLNQCHHRDNAGP